MENFKFTLWVIEVGKTFERIAGFDNKVHAIKFANSILKDYTTEQFLMIDESIGAVVYIKAGKKIDL